MESQDFENSSQLHQTSVLALSILILIFFQNIVTSFVFSFGYIFLNPLDPQICQYIHVCLNMVHHCTWACYLQATLLGLAVGQNVPSANSFLHSPTSLSSFVCQPSKNMPVRSWAIFMLPSCHPLPPISSVLVLIVLVSILTIFFIFFLLYFLLNLSIQHFFSKYIFFSREAFAPS